MTYEKVNGWTGEPFDVVIPARNEEKTIATIVNTFTTHPLIKSVIVSVDADTTDNTWDVVSNDTDATWICSGYHNRGKGQCVNAGLQHVTTRRVILCDADVTGLTHDHIGHLMHPTDGMILGVPDFPTPAELAATGHPLRWHRRLRYAWPLVTGQRSVPTAMAQAIDLHGYVMETQLNIVAEAHNVETITCQLRGLRSPFRLTPKRRQEMERDRAWAIQNGWLPSTTGGYR